MPNRLITRKMRPEDAHGVATVHTLSWRHAYRGIVDQAFLDSLDIEKRTASWKRGIESNEPPIIRLLAEDEGKVVGLVTGLGNREPSLLPECDGELWAIYSLPEVAGKGVGHALVEHFNEEMRKAGKTRYAIWVLKENHRARAFYERQGGVLHTATKEAEIGKQKLLEVSYIVSLR